MKLGQIVLLVYAVLLGVGGFIGYQTAGSMPSLIAGLGSAVVALVALGLSRWHPAAGYLTGGVLALALCVVFWMRLSETGKFMPAGLLLILSAAVLILLAIDIRKNRRSQQTGP